MRENIAKPLSIERDDFIKSMIDLINGSKLPPFIIEPVLKDMYNDVRMASSQQLERDKQKYEEMLQKQAD